MNLSAETLEKIETTIPKYPEKRSAVMPLLHFVQSEQKYISNEAIEWIAEKLEIEPINVLEVVTFFPYYRQEKLGTVHVRVCRTLSCALMGAYKLGDELEKALDCRWATPRKTDLSRSSMANAWLLAEPDLWYSWTKIYMRN